MDGFIMENPINMDDLEVPLLLETPTYWCSIFCLRTFVPFDSAEILCFLRWAWNIQTSWIYSVHLHFMTFLCQDTVRFLAKPKQSFYREHVFFRQGSYDAWMLREITKRELCVNLAPPCRARTTCDHPLLIFETTSFLGGFKPQTKETRSFR